MTFTEQLATQNKIEISEFCKNNTSEIHLIIHGQNKLAFNDALLSIEFDLKETLAQKGYGLNHLIFRRYFVTDATNQMQILNQLKSCGDFNNEACATSIIQQQPLKGSKVSLWVYAVKSMGTKSECTQNANETIWAHNSYTHCWNVNQIAGQGLESSYDQTENIFNNYHKQMNNKGFSVAENCIRTWLFVRDVDTNYHGVVEARNKYFDTIGLTEDTHFISSTGIEGRHYKVDKKVVMDAYTIGGIQKEQIKFLTALNHLNPTHEYGVRFERGTSVDFGDRRHVYLSGTASIDHKGEIVHENHIEGQVNRTLENVKALLADANSNINDIAQMIIYLRDTADYDYVNSYFNKYFGKTPKVIVLAPVCRPGWLIEIECIAIKDINNSAYKNF